MNQNKAGFSLIDDEKMGPPPSYVASVPQCGNAAAAQRRVGNGAAFAGEPPSGFYVKKWILLVTMFFNIAGLLAAIFCLDYIVEIVVNNSVATGKLVIDPDNNQEMIEMMVKLAFTLLFRFPFLKPFSHQAMIKKISFVMLVFFILVELLFVYGVAKHHLGLTTVYTVLCILGTISMLLRCIANPSAILDTLVFAITTGVAYSYMKDLRMMRDNRVRMGLNVI